MSFRRRMFLLLPLALSGCGTEFRLFHPAGPVAGAEWFYTLLNTGIMLIIILPTTIATLVFALRYRKSRNATYDPSFSHSLGLEFAMWGMPLLITVILAFCTFQSVFAVNPAGPTSLELPGPAPQTLNVDVITTDWQWIFVYPQLHIATIDDLVVPADENIKVELTSATVVNDFFIPQVAPMIDVMPGMRTLDGFRVDQPGSYEGFSADFSGAGFSWMQFSTHILSPADFAAWTAKTQAAPDQLNMTRFLQLAEPTINEGAKPLYFSHADPNLFLEVYDTVRQGRIFPVPMDMDAKAPYPSPMTGKNNEIKSTP